MLLPLLMGIISALAKPLPVCKVSSEYTLAPGLSSPYTGIAFRYIFVTVEGKNCSDVKIRLGNYGGKFSGEEIHLKSGDTVTLGPVPTYRTVERVLENGKVFNILLKRRSP